MRWSYDGWYLIQILHSLGMIKCKHSCCRTSQARHVSPLSPCWTIALLLAEVSMSFWQNKVVLVTGGSSGLGRVIAEAFAAAGAKLAIVGLEATASRAGRRRDAGRRPRRAGHPRRHHPPGRRGSAVRPDVGPLRAARRVGEQRRPLDARQGARYHARTVPRTDGTELDRPGALHPGRRAALAPSSAATWSTSARWRPSRPPAGSARIRPRSLPWRPTRSSCGWSLGPQGLHVLLVCPGPIQRKDARLYPLEGLEDVPESARAPGAGVRVRAIPPQDLARAILRACQRRRPELVVPGQGPAAVRPRSALAESGRLDRAAEEWIVGVVVSCQW